MNTQIDDLYITGHARYRMAEHGIPKRILELIFTDEALTLLAWPRSYSKLTRQQLASKEQRIMRIVREPKPEKWWWVAYQDDDTIITVIKMSNDGAVNYIKNRLKNADEGGAIKRRAPVIRPDEIEPRVTSVSEVDRIVTSKPAPRKVKEYSLDELVYG